MYVAFSLSLQYAVITSFLTVTFSSIELNFKRRECSIFVFLTVFIGLSEIILIIYIKTISFKIE
jgi:hypothetical protein